MKLSILFLSQTSFHLFGGKISEAIRSLESKPDIIVGKSLSGTGICRGINFTYHLN